MWDFWRSETEVLVRLTALIARVLLSVVCGPGWRKPWLPPDSNVNSTDRYPGASETSLSQITDAGVIVGLYIDSIGVAHGFKLEGGQFSTIDFPGALETLAYDINLNGHIVGEYFGAGFKAMVFCFGMPPFRQLTFLPRTNVATSINSDGQIAGFTSVQFGAESGFPTLGFLMSEREHLTSFSWRQ
jgi:uncharacterized membrane protein